MRRKQERLEAWMGRHGRQGSARRGWLGNADEKRRCCRAIAGRKVRAGGLRLFPIFSGRLAGFWFLTDRSRSTW